MINTFILCSSIQEPIESNYSEEGREIPIPGNAAVNPDQRDSVGYIDR